MCFKKDRSPINLVPLGRKACDTESNTDELEKLEADMTKSRKAVAKLGVKRRCDEPAPAPIKKRPAAKAKVAAKAKGPPAKRPAAPEPLGKLDLAARGNEAREAPVRRYDLDNLRGRMETAALESGAPHDSVVKMRAHVRAKAGAVYDSVHPG